MDDPFQASWRLAARAFRARRAGACVTQRAVALRAGVRVERVRAWERGLLRLQPEEERELATALADLAAEEARRFNEMLE